MNRSSFNEGWYVRTERGSGSSEPVGPVTVPYDAMLFEPRDPATPNGHHTGFYPGGVYRYSKSFTVPDEWRDRHVTLEFEGVYMRSEVFVNGRLAGGRPSGYAVFTVALDEHLEYGAENLVEVVAHNDQMPNSRWYTGSGIYRPVHLLVGGPDRIAADGVRISTASIEGDDAALDVSIEVVLGGRGAGSFIVRTVLTGPDGAVAASVEESVPAGSGEATSVTRQITVSFVKPWSVERPNLYTAVVSLLDADSTIVDETRVVFGIRTVEVDSRRGFRLNGVPLKLRGACIHHDNGVIGAHTLDVAEDRRIRLLKESGFNAIRSAHNPLARETLRACDRHGVLVMDELTDVWRRPKVTNDLSDEFEQWWERDLEAMVAKDVNHPSVVMYSIGNEIAETATTRGIETNRRLAERTRELDPTRLVTNCINGFLNLISPQDDEKLAEKRAAQKESGEAPNKNLILVLNYLMAVLERTLKYIVRLPTVDRRTRAVYDELDVAGYNYMSGRYRSDRKRYPDRVIVGSESNPNDTVAIWSDVETLPNVIGDFTWTGWDYIGEAGYAAVHYDEPRRLFSPWPGLLAGMPVIDITGHRQTQSYLNEIVWHLRSGPYIAVQPVNHAGQKKSCRPGRTDSIRSWSWEGFEGREAIVEVYADAARVELFLDGRLLGTQPAGSRKGYRTHFTVPYRPGELTAIAFDSAGREIGRDALASARSGLRLRVESETATLTADGNDLAYLPIELIDDGGILLPLADREVTVEVSGTGTLLGFGSAQPITTEGFSSTRHSTYYGRALAVVRAGHEAGEVVVVVTADDCEPVTVVVPVRPVT